MVAIAVIAVVASTVITTVSAVKQAEREAKLQREIGEFEASLVRRRGKTLIGRQRAAFAASGVTLEGTPQDLITATAAQVELDALRTLFKFEIGASNAEARGNAAILSGIAGGISAIGGIAAGGVATPQATPPATTTTAAPTASSPSILGTQRRGGGFVGAGAGSRVPTIL